MKPTASDILRRYKDEDLPEFSEVDLDNVNQTGNFGNAPIHVACVRGKIEEVEALISGGADLDAAGELGNRPLHEAAGQGHSDVIELLLQAGADMNTVNDDGYTACQVAEHSGHMETVALFEDWLKRARLRH